MVLRYSTSKSRSLKMKHNKLSSVKQKITKKKKKQFGGGNGGPGGVPPLPPPPVPLPPIPSLSQQLEEQRGRLKKIPPPVTERKTSLQHDQPPPRPPPPSVTPLSTPSQQQKLPTKPAPNTPDPAYEDIKNYMKGQLSNFYNQNQDKSIDVMISSINIPVDNESVELDNYKSFKTLLSDKQFSNFDDEINIDNSDKKIYIKYGKLFKIINEYVNRHNIQNSPTVTNYPMYNIHTIFKEQIIEVKKLLFYMKHLTLDRKLFYNKKKDIKMHYYYTLRKGENILNNIKKNELFKVLGFLKINELYYYILVGFQKEGKQIMGRTDLVELNEYSSEKIMYNLQPVNINFDLHKYVFNIFKNNSNSNDDKFKKKIIEIINTSKDYTLENLSNLNYILIMNIRAGPELETEPKSESEPTKLRNNFFSHKIIGFSISIQKIFQNEEGNEFLLHDSPLDINLFNLTLDVKEQNIFNNPKEKKNKIKIRPISVNFRVRLVMGELLKNNNLDNIINSEDLILEPKPLDRHLTIDHFKIQEDGYFFESKKKNNNTIFRDKELNSDLKGKYFIMKYPNTKPKEFKKAIGKTDKYYYKNKFKPIAFFQILKSTGDEIRKERYENIYILEGYKNFKTKITFPKELNNILEGPTKQVNTESSSNTKTEQGNKPIPPRNIEISNTLKKEDLRKVPQEPTEKFPEGKESSGGDSDINQQTSNIRAKATKVGGGKNKRNRKNKKNKKNKKTNKNIKSKYSKSNYKKKNTTQRQISSRKNLVKNTKKKKS